MAKRKVIVEIAGSARLSELAAKAPTGESIPIDRRSAPVVPALEFDLEYGMVPLPAGDGGETSPESTSYLMRGEIEEQELNQITLNPHQPEGIKGIFIDARIEGIRICPGDPALGTDRDVERLLNVPKLKSRGMDGTRVLVAIVDTGFNADHLRSKGKHPNVDTTNGWDPNGTPTPGQYPVNHGTMCAYDALIGAPNCTLVDIALLQSSGSIMEGFLSDAVKGYNHLRGVLKRDVLTGRFRGLVVNNSWGMFHPSWDFPVGHPSNYSDNPNHPFNRMVKTLAREGADIVFAAGNCGADCADWRCQGVTSRAIYGANGHPEVTCVGGVDVTGDRVGYSSQGPGRLDQHKPDVCGYTHFEGSGVYDADGGTSAASPVVAGVIAAIRTKRAYRSCCPSTFPRAIRSQLRRTAIDKGASGFDYDYGWGIIDGSRLADVFQHEAVSTPSPVLNPGSEEEETAAGLGSGSGMNPGESVMHIGDGFSSPMAPGSLLRTFFARISPDSTPGRNQLTINGLPSGTRVISVWMTEWLSPDNPHAGNAVFSTQSVQLYANGTKCRVIYHSSWGSHLPAAAQVIYGPA